MKPPGPDHPISIEPSNSRVVVKAGGRVVAQSRGTLVLREAGYMPVFYIPRHDADLSLLTRSDLTTYCPYKGDCHYYSIPSAGENATNAVWTYESPYEAVAAIKGHLAFYADRVDAIEEHAVSA